MRRVVWKEGDGEEGGRKLGREGGTEGERWYKEMDDTKKRENWCFND